MALATTVQSRLRTEPAQALGVEQTLPPFPGIILTLDDETEICWKPEIVEMATATLGEFYQSLLKTVP